MEPQPILDAVSAWARSYSNNTSAGAISHHTYDNGQYCVATAQRAEEGIEGFEEPILSQADLSWSAACQATALDTDMSLRKKALRASKSGATTTQQSLSSGFIDKFATATSIKGRESPKSSRKSKEASAYQQFTDVRGCTFHYNKMTNVAVLSDQFKQWPVTLGPVELSNGRGKKAGAKKQLSVKYRELDEHGCVHTHEYLPGLTPGTVDRQHSKNTGLVMRKEIASMIKLHRATGGDMKQVALRAMSCLEYFLPVVQPYHYETAKPSHWWAMDEAGTNYLAELLSILPALCAAAQRTLQTDDMLLDVSSPAYVLGDLHGNYRDLQYFASQFWRAGVDICPSDLLFLGDYVDRGPHSVELISYLLALKVMYPKKVFLLRGNHELESVCGNVDYYGDGSFRTQLEVLVSECGMEGMLEEIWSGFMTVFEWMPLAATIDKNIFCCHAGLPRAIMEQAEDDESTILDRIRGMKRPLSEEGEIDGSADCIAMDILWADPASSRESRLMGQHGLPPGFAINLDRGGDACVFGEQAVNTFRKQTGCDYILRAHQPPDKGIRYQAGASVITVFSSSHYCGMNNSAALIVVSKDQLDIVTTGATTALDKSSGVATGVETVL
eukprot:m.111825 g.111825  ORF g.111825 m.111825 type:complete len:613 (-) comp13464_c0_seq2:1399-3237(-)